MPHLDGAKFILSCELEGQEFFALNTGPKHCIREAIPFCVNRKSQQEVDELWRKLSEGV